MYTFLIITAILTLIAWGCLRKKFSFGIVPALLASAILSGIICVILNVSTYRISGPDRVWNDTLCYKSRQDKFSMTEESVIGTDFDLDEINKVLIKDTLKTPYIEVIRRHESKDMNLIYDIGFKDNIKHTLYLNPKQYEIYKAFRDSLDKRKDSL